MEELKGLLKSNFEYFSRKLSGCSCRIDKEVDNFLFLLKKNDCDISSLGKWFAWNYVAFQFNYWHDKKTRLDGRIPANWIFGNKAVERWLNRDMVNWSYSVWRFLKEAEIEDSVDFFGASVEDGYEEERKRYYNTNRGLSHCLQFARYSDRSATCIVCRNRKDCRLLWK